MQDADTLTYVNSITEKFNGLANSKVAYTDITMAVSDPATGKRMVRSRETNLGDLCADAYRNLLGTDIGLVNGGGIRADIRKGDVTYSNIVSVHPFGNMACAVEVTGQKILDALEMGVRTVGTGENGGFLQVSGVTFDIDSTIPSSVVLDEKSMFVSVNGDYRVKNVKIGGEPLDLNKIYTVASHNFMLKSGGDGYSMFVGSKVLIDEVKVDNQVLIEYITQSLGGKIASDSIYANPYGSGRMRVILEKKAPTATEDGYVKYQVGNEEVTEVLEATGTVTPEPTQSSSPEPTESAEPEPTQSSSPEPTVSVSPSPTVHVHQYKSKITPATVKKDGKNVQTCSKCKKQKTTVIPRISKVTISATSYTYNGKKKTPSVKVKDRKGKTLSAGKDYKVTYQTGRAKVGKYKVTITFKGNYKGSSVKYFTIKPKSTKIEIIKQTGKKLTVTWKKVTTEVSGYQVQLSTSSKFAGKVTKTILVKDKKKKAATFSKVTKEKTYYIRIRTYKTVKIGAKQVKIYSDWKSSKIVTRVKG